MHRKVIFVLIATILIFVLGAELGLSKEEMAKPDTSKIMRKFDEVLTNQAKMLKQFEEIRQELAIIKVRASR